LFISHQKTILFDWFLIVPLFPITALLDLYLKSSLFFLVVGYFCGNIVAIAFTKAAQFMWTRSLDAGDAERQEWYFINLLRISPNAWKQLHARQLLMCIWMVAMVFADICMRRQAELSGMHLSFAIGVFSSLTSYLGPVAAGAFLTDSELSHVLDHAVLVHIGKAQPQQQQQQQQPQQQQESSSTTKSD
jgi:hypothetical protein